MSKYYINIVLFILLNFSVNTLNSQKIGFEAVFQNLSKSEIYFKMKSFDKILETENKLLYAFPNSSDFIGFHFGNEKLHSVQYFETKSSKEEVLSLIEDKISSEQGRLEIFNDQKWFIYDNLKYGFNYEYLEANGNHFFVSICTTKI